jgi:hypothetical protein
MTVSPRGNYLHAGVVLWLLVLILLAGCTRNAQIRTDLKDCPISSTGQSPPRCLVKNSIETYPTYSLSFVEFDDQGWLYDPAQMIRTMHRLEREARNNEVLLVVFVHGWRHNASFDDDNVKTFRETLKLLAKPSPLPSSEPPRKVFGVYVGWRGRSLQGSTPWELLSFYGRKTAADHVAKGSVRELFARLREFANHHKRKGADHKKVKFLIVGHSFGGLAVYSALSEFLMESAVASPEQDTKRFLTPFADLVVLVNPAFEAVRYEPLHQIARHRGYAPGQPPVFVSLTTDNDWATRYAFPFGRWINSLTQNERGDARQKEANKNTLGHVERYRTHRLTTCNETPRPGSETNALACGCGDWQGEQRPDQDNGAVDIANQDLVKERIKAKAFNDHWRDPGSGRLRPQWVRHFCGGLVLSQETGFENNHPETPFWNVYTDSSIINGHGGFNTSQFRDFLRQLLLEQ